MTSRRKGAAGSSDGRDELGFGFTINAVAATPSGRTF
jgi:hypothetical protein